MPFLKFADGSEPPQETLEVFYLAPDVECILTIQFKLSQLACTSTGGFMAIYMGRDQASGEKFVMSVFYDVQGHWQAKYIDRIGDSSTIIPAFPGRLN
jgi:hypothetical protein